MSNQDPMKVGFPRAWNVPGTKAPNPYPFGKHRFCVGPGAGGMYGEGYPYHRYPPFCFNRGWYNRTDLVFQTKGISAFAEEGNMPLKYDGVTPEDFFPRCIYVDFWTRHVCNAVGFSNFGIEFYVLRGYFDSMGRDWIINFMAIRPTSEEREKEVRHFARVLRCHWKRFAVKPRICFNHGCPNVSHKASKAAEIRRHHEIFIEELGFEVEIFDNFSVVAPVELLLETAEFTSGLFIVNTVPHARMVKDGKSPTGKVSPMTRRGLDKEGGWSGERCREYALALGSEVRVHDQSVVMIGGNGIHKPKHILEFRDARFNAVQVATGPVILPFDDPDEMVFTANNVTWFDQWLAVA